MRDLTAFAEWCTDHLTEGATVRLVAGKSFGRGKAAAAPVVVTDDAGQLIEELEAALDEFDDEGPVWARMFRQGANHGHGPILGPLTPGEDEDDSPRDTAKGDRTGGLTISAEIARILRTTNDSKRSADTEHRHALREIREWQSTLTDTQIELGKARVLIAHLKTQLGQPLEDGEIGEITSMAKQVFGQILPHIPALIGVAPSAPASGSGAAAAPTVTPPTDAAAALELWKDAASAIDGLLETAGPQLVDAMADRLVAWVVSLVQRRPAVLTAARKQALSVLLPFFMGG